MASLKTIARAASLAAAVLLMAGCSVSSAGRSESRSAPPPMGVIDAGDVRFEALAPQTPTSGVCGLFLWGRSAQEPVLILAAFSIPTEARVRTNGRDRTLRRTAAEGQAAFGHFETQTFSDGRLTLTVDVTFDTSGRMRDGARVERGVIRTTDREGAEVIVPVGGMVACEP